jgi:hypothetical protein
VPAAIPNAARGRKGFRPAAADGYAISGARIQGECEPGPSDFGTSLTRPPMRNWMTWVFSSS